MANGGIFLFWEIARIEKKLAKLIEKHPDEWAIVAGVQEASVSKIHDLANLMRKEGFLEIEAMLHWRVEQMEMDLENITECQK